MIGVILAVPVFLVVLMLQTTVMSTLPLLDGTADLVLLVLLAWSVQERVRSAVEWAAIGGALVGIISHAPLVAPIAGYLVVAILARVLRARIWQSPLVSLFLATFAGSVILPAFTWAALQFEGTSLPLVESINRVVLPGALLNLLLALPVYTIIAGLAQSVYPEEVAE
ncbi:MAG: rod shape-determining protein MreD [Anaerolineaceae bacterium]|nr:rod shape-determining protein MreD [Anaerolineaceae bacterium]